MSRAIYNLESSTSVCVATELRRLQPSWLRRRRAGVCAWRHPSNELHASRMTPHQTHPGFVPPVFRVKAKSMVNKLLITASNG